MNFFNDILNPIELPLLKEFHDAIRCDFLDFIMPGISTLCKWGLFWIALAAVLLLFRETRKTGLTVALALAIGLILCNLILKPVTARIRPYEVDTSIVLLLKKETEFSFPSGHTIASFEGAVGVFMHNRKWGAAAIVLAVLISFSRLYLMMHYFTDVIVSAILGTIIAVVAYHLGKWLIQKTKLPV